MEGKGLGFINKEFLFQLANIKLNVDSLFKSKLHKKGRLCMLHVEGKIHFNWGFKWDW